MDHGLMMGMLIGGVLLSAPPIALGIYLWVLYFRQYRIHREGQAER